jgi:excisionase family DNA binding protein
VSTSIDELLARLEDALAASNRKWLTVEQSAEYSGLSATSIRRMIDAGQLQGRKPIPGRILIRSDHLEHVIATSPPAVETRVGFNKGRGRGRRRIA